MRTLVTGATGLLGNNVTRRLLSRGDRLRVLTRSVSDPRPLAGLDVEIVHGDVRDKDSVARACRDMDLVIHAAAVVHIGWSDSAIHRAVNFEGTRSVGRAALRCGARMIHVSTTDTVGVGTFDKPSDEDTPYGGNPPCPYSLTKLAGEEVIQELVSEGLDAVIVNPSYLLGPNDWKPSSGR